ncbi:MAG: DEAD/DEAH box helicase [Chlamydiia bacterium]
MESSGYWIVRWDDLYLTRVIWRREQGRPMECIVLSTHYGERGDGGKGPRSIICTCLWSLGGKTSQGAAPLSEGEADSLLSRAKDLHRFLDRKGLSLELGFVVQGKAKEIPSIAIPVLHRLFDSCASGELRIPPLSKGYRLEEWAGHELFVLVDPDAMKDSQAEKMVEILDFLEGSLKFSSNSEERRIVLDTDDVMLARRSAEEQRKAKEAEARRLQQAEYGLVNARNALRRAVSLGIGQAPHSDENLCLVIGPIQSVSSKMHPNEWKWGFKVGQVSGSGNVQVLGYLTSLSAMEQTPWVELLRDLGRLEALRNSAQSYYFSHGSLLHDQADAVRFRAVLAAGRRGRLFISTKSSDNGYSYVMDPVKAIAPVRWLEDRAVQWQWHPVAESKERPEGYSWRASRPTEPEVRSWLTDGASSIEMPPFGQKDFWMRLAVSPKQTCVADKEVYIPKGAAKPFTKEILEAGLPWDPVPGVSVRETRDPPTAGLRYDAETLKVKAYWDYGNVQMPASTAQVTQLKQVAETDQELIVVHRQLDHETKVLEELSSQTALSIPSLVRGALVVKGGTSTAAERRLMQWARAGVHIQGVPQWEGERVNLDEEELVVEFLDEGGWLTFSSNIDVNGNRTDLVPILQGIVRQEGGFDKLVSRSDDEVIEWLLDDGRMATISLKKIRETLQWIEQFFGMDPPRSLNPTEVLGVLLAVQAQEALRSRWKAPDTLVRQVMAIRDEPEPDLAQSALLDQLRPYQRVSVKWALKLFRADMGGLIADEMGLGKTIQSIAIIDAQFVEQKGHPSLILCPLSVVWNWASEFHRFAPRCKVAVIGRCEKTTRDWDLAAKADVIICPYSLAFTDQDQLQARRYHICVMDEAHTLRNPRTQIYKVVASLQARYRLALTGTPLQNNALDLWAIFSLLVPGLVGDLESFQKAFKQGDPTGMQRRMKVLSRITAPFTMRRRKQDVDLELPPIDIVTRLVTLAEDQADLYESMRSAALVEVDQLIQKKGMGSSKIQLLAALTRLRQLCCDPKLVDAKKFGKVSSSKVSEALSIIEELNAEGRRFLVFSSFVSLLDIMETEIKKLGIPTLMFTGKTQDRESLIGRFEGGEATALLVSLKAGGVGLNLTSADTVILLDPWWNPAMEAQAIGRTHRHGQSKSVTVFRLIARGTIEERIHALQARKQLLAEIALGEDVENAGGRRELQEFNEELIHDLLAPSERELAVGG